MEDLPEGVTSITVPEWGGEVLVRRLPDDGSIHLIEEDDNTTRVVIVSITHRLNGLLRVCDIVSGWIRSHHNGRE